MESTDSFLSSSDDSSLYYDTESSEEYVPKEYPPGYDMHDFPFDTVERAMPDVEMPRNFYLDKEEFFIDDQFLDVENIKEHLRCEGKLSLEQVQFIVNGAKRVFQEEDNIIVVSAPLTVCGDIHGQFYDLLKLLRVGGDPESTQYLFLGDYVDRGMYSCEVVFLLFAYKITYPDTFFMIRGNHECRHLTEYFTFKSECEHKYNIDVYNLIMDAFDSLPLAAVLNKQFLCVHGGLSPDIQAVDEINNIMRFIEPPISGPLCDLLWSDPQDDYASPGADYVYNDIRGCSYAFNHNAVCKFINQNNLLSIIRAHEVQDAGYKMHLKNEKTGFPSLITLFSAPNYCDTYGNKAAVLKYEDNVLNIRQFNYSEPPYTLPNFLNSIEWSLPFVAGKIEEFLATISGLLTSKEDEMEVLNEIEEASKRKKNHAAVKTKLKSISKILKMYKAIKKVETSESQDSEERSQFETVRSLDKGEARPPIQHQPLIRPVQQFRLKTRSSSSPVLRNIKPKKQSMVELLKDVDQTETTPEIQEFLLDEAVPQPKLKRRSSMDV